MSYFPILADRETGRLLKIQFSQVEEKEICFFCFFRRKKDEVDGSSGSDKSTAAVKGEKGR